MTVQDQSTQVYTQWYELAKVFAHEQQNPQTFANTTIGFAIRLFQSLTSENAEQIMTDFTKVIEIIQIKPKFQCLQQYIKPLFNTEFHFFIANLTNKITKLSAKVYLEMFQQLTLYQDFQLMIEQDQTTYSELCFLIASQDSTITIKRQATKTLQDIIIKQGLASFKPESFEINLNSNIFIPQNTTIQHIVKCFIASSVHYCDLQLINSILQDFQLINIDDTLIKQQLCQQQSQVVNGMMIHNEETRRLIIQSLTQMEPFAKTENAIFKITILMQLLAPGQEIDQPLLQLVESLMMNIPSPQLIKYVFQFKLSNQTFIHLQTIQRQLNLQTITDCILKPLYLFVQKLPKQIQDDAIINECCVFLLNTFQCQLAQQTLASANNSQNLIEASRLYVSIMLQLMRRGYGRNERFQPILEKIIKVNNYNGQIISEIATDNNEDTLTDQKLISEVLRDVIVDAKVEECQQGVQTILMLARSSCIAIMAVLECIENHLEKLLPFISTEIIIQLIQSPQNNQLYDQQLIQVIQSLPTMIQKQNGADSYKIIHCALIVLTQKFMNFDQIVDSCAQQLLLRLFQLPNGQYFVTPPIFALKILVDISYVSAPFLAVYLPELFLSHPNVQAQTVSCYFLAMKYGFVQSNVQNPQIQMNIVSQQQYFQQYAPMLVNYIVSTFETPAMNLVFQNKLSTYQKTINVNNYQLNNAKLKLLSLISRFNPSIQQRSLSLLEKISKVYGKEAAGQGEIELKQFYQSITNQQVLNIAIDENATIEQYIAYFFTNIQQICGCGCNLSGWETIMAVLKEAGVDWKAI